MKYNVELGDLIFRQFHKCRTNSENLSVPFMLCWTNAAFVFYEKYSVLEKLFIFESS